MSSEKLHTKPLFINNHLVPGIWRYMLPYDFQNLYFPQEKQASCMNCPNVVGKSYHANYKCCTFHPRVPNFMLGLAYKYDAKSQKIMDDLLLKGWFLPEGMQATAQLWSLYLRDVSEDYFGKSKDVLCPFLMKENGNCGIYLYRNSVCSTFFCKHDHGKNGDSFWDSVQILVAQVESILMQWSLKEIGYDLEGLLKRMDKLSKNIKNLCDKDTKLWKKEVLSEIWGEDYKNALDVYVKCAEVIEDNLDNLWEIAKVNDIDEAIKYEMATHTVVPEKYKDEIDDTYNEDEVTVPAKSLWIKVRNNSKKLDYIIDGTFQIDPKIVVTKNNSKDKMSIYHKDSARVLKVYRDKKHKNFDEDIYLSDNHMNILDLFTDKQIVNQTFMAKLSALNIKNSAELLTQLAERKIIRIVK